MTFPSELRQMIPHRERRPSDLDHQTVEVSGPGCALAGLLTATLLGLALGACLPL